MQQMYTTITIEPLRWFCPFTNEYYHHRTKLSGVEREIVSNKTLDIWMYIYNVTQHSNMSSAKKVAHRLISIRTLVFLCGIGDWWINVIAPVLLIGLLILHFKSPISSFHPQETQLMISTQRWIHNFNSSYTSMVKMVNMLRLNKHPAFMYLWRQGMSLPYLQLETNVTWLTMSAW